MISLIVATSCPSGSGFIPEKAYEQIVASWLLPITRLTPNHILTYYRGVCYIYSLYNFISWIVEDDMEKQMTTHLEEIVRLKRIEGQIRGIQKMIEEKRYCIDILTQISSVIGAIKSVEENILERHMKGCVRQSFNTGRKEDRAKKIEEVIGVLRKFRKY